MAEQDDKEKLAEALRAKLVARLAPVLADPRTRLRTVVGVKVLAIVTREIGHGRPRRDEDWESLKKSVEGQEGARELVESLEAGIRTYADELQSRIASGQVQEAPARAAAVKVLQQALLKKLQLVPSAPEG